ncbi:hypothetical protein CMI37_02130 [Candidatus Pacearchaeota archaeon]|nr:hypothetical protein [Candidatus Pacearchaeota archaeon]|tara:strand:+ start:3258 stop:3659 length:402 start_codon:yes stop_codon:yes gene_type:complete
MKDTLEIFEGKTFEDLTKDIYENSKNKKLQLDLLIQEIHGFIRSIDDAVIISPIVKEIYEVSVKNDEHLVKLASVLQRIITRSKDGSDEDSYGLTENEKEELMQTLQETISEVERKNDRLNKVTQISKTFTEG